MLFLLRPPGARDSGGTEYYIITR